VALCARPCNCGCVCVSHTGRSGRFLALPLTLLKRFTPAGSPDDKLLAAEQIPFQAFYFTGSKLCFELLAAGGRSVHVWSAERSEEAYLLFNCRKSCHLRVGGEQMKGT